MCLASVSEEFQHWEAGMGKLFVEKSGFATQIRIKEIIVNIQYFNIATLQSNTYGYSILN